MFEFFANNPIVTFAIAIAAFVILAATRNQLVRAAGAVLGLLAAPVQAVYRGINGFMPRLSDWIKRGLRALTVRKTDADDEAGWAGYDLLMPAIWLVLGLTLVASDLLLVDLRLAKLTGLRPHLVDSGLPLDIFMAVMFTAIAATFAFAIPELRKASLARRPWATLSEGDRSRLLKISVICLGLTVAAAIVLLVWGEGEAGRGVYVNEFQSSAPTLFWLLIGFPLLAGNALALWAALTAPAALVVLALMGFRALLSFLMLIARVIVRILDMLLEVFTTVLDVAARPTAGCLNWLGLRFPEQWRPEKIHFEDRPRIDVEDGESEAAETEEPTAEARAAVASEDVGVSTAELEEGATGVVPVEPSRPAAEEPQGDANGSVPAPVNLRGRRGIPARREKWLRRIRRAKAS